MDEKFMEGLGVEIRETEPDGSVRRGFEYNIKMDSKEIE
jgi:hypothetical protein